MRQGAHNLRQLAADALRCLKPAIAPAADELVCPLFIYQCVQARARVQRQAPKRVSIKVDEARIRDGEALAEGSQLIGTIQGCGAGGGKVHGQDGNCGERGASSRRIGSPCMRRTVRRWLLVHFAGLRQVVAASQGSGPRCINAGGQNGLRGGNPALQKWHLRRSVERCCSGVSVE